MPMAVSGRPTLTGANADTDGMAHRAKSELTTFIILDILCLLCIDANNPIRVQFRRLLYNRTTTTKRGACMQGHGDGLAFNFA